MRFFGYFIKTLIENLRDWKILMFSIGFAPCFVLILFMMYGTGTQSYNVALINQDQGKAGQEVISDLRQSTFEGGNSKYKLYLNESLETALKKLKSRRYDAVGVFAQDFSSTLKKAATQESYSPSKFKLYGDTQNMRYSVASIYLLTDLDEYVVEHTHYKQPVILDETFVGKGKSLTDFDMYVPGLVVFALLNVIFSAGSALIREVETGTMNRLVLSKLKVGEFIGSVGLVQSVLCVLSMLLALWVAMGCGFGMKGDMKLILLIGVLSSVGVMGIALLTVSMLKSVYDLMTVGIIPYFIVMFFGGIFFPLPPLTLFNIGDQVFLINDLLPLSLSVSALNRVMNFGAQLSDLSYELTGIVVISAVYFIAGLALFQKKHMRVG